MDTKNNRLIKIIKCTYFRLIYKYNESNYSKVGIIEILKRFMNINYIKSNTMKTLIFILSSTLLVSCSVQKELTYVKQTPITNNSPNHSSYKSRDLEEQRELADEMDSWSCEEIEEWKRDYVFSEINIILKNGDTLKYK